MLLDSHRGPLRLYKCFGSTIMSGQKKQYLL